MVELHNYYSIRKNFLKNFRGTIIQFFRVPPPDLVGGDFAPVAHNVHLERSQGLHCRMFHLNLNAGRSHEALGETFSHVYNGEQCLRDSLPHEEPPLQARSRLLPPSAPDRGQRAALRRRGIAPSPIGNEPLDARDSAGFGLSVHSAAEAAPMRATQHCITRTSAPCRHARPQTTSEVPSSRRRRASRTRAYRP